MNDNTVQLTPWLAHKAQADDEAVEAQELLGEVSELPIDSPEDVEFIGESLKEVKGKIKALEEMRTRATKPMGDALEEVRSWFRGPIQFYKQVEVALKDRILAAHERNYAKQRAALTEAAEAAKRGDGEGSMTAIERARAQALPAVKGISIRHGWDFKVVDLDKIPRGYFALDMVMIRAEIHEHDGNINIPGIEVVRTTSVAASSK